MQYLKYPTKTMKITQNYNGTYSHSLESKATPPAYPIDEGCADSGRDYFYAPCDVVVKRIYGVGNKGANTIWMESQSEVMLANGKTSFVTIRVTHPEDDDLSKYKVGQKFKQGDKLFREGKDGNATGNHFHIEVNTCKFSALSNNGWAKNSKGEYSTTPNSIKPEQAFYVDKNFTTIKNTNGLNFKYMPISSSNGSNSSVSVSYYKKYVGKSNSLVDALILLKIDSSFSNRKKIAKKNGISLYIGSASQNIKLLNLLKQGKLIK